MKKIFILGLTFVSFFYSPAQTIVWTGTTSTNFFDNSNWVGGIGYTTGVDILFDATGGSNACIIGTDITVNSFSVMSGYSGVIDMSAGDHNINTNFIVNSGTVIESSSSVNMAGNGFFSLGASGTYSTNGGAFCISIIPGQTFVFAGDIVLVNLNISTATSGSQRNIDFGSNLTTDNITINSGTILNRPIAYQGTIHVKNSLALSGISTTTLSGNTANFIFDGANASITGPGAANRMFLPNIQINTIGNLSMSSEINLTGNWTGSQGSLSASSSTVNMYGTSAVINGPAAAFDNLILRTGSSVSFPSGEEVMIGGNFNCAAATPNFATTHTLSFNGTGPGAQTISGAFTVGNIHVYSGNRTVNLNSAVSLIESITVDASATFAAGSNLTLVSNSSGTARVATSLGTITGTGVKVETFIPGNFTGWTNMGVRGVYAQPITSWDTYVSSVGSNGIPMTCVGCFYDPSVMGTPFTSVQEWNEPTSGYIDIASSFVFTPGKGIWAYVGDGPTNTGDLKVVNTGSLVQGSISVPVTSAGSGADLGYNLVANPYPCPISWQNTYLNGFTALSVDASICVWNPDLAGGLGDYAYYNASGNVSSPNGPGELTDVIAGGQAFYVLQNNIKSTVDFDENCKINSSSSLLKPAENVNVALFRLKLAGSNDWDATAFCFHKDASLTYDKKFDARKMFHTAGYAGYPGAYSKYTSISSKDSDSKDYAINTLPPLTNSLSIPVLARVSATGSYTISAYDFKDFPMCVGLLDKLNNSYHDLRLSPYVFTINDTTSTPRFELVLCKDERLNTTGISEKKTESNSIFINQDAQGAYVKTVFEKNTKATISVFNVIGQKLMQDIQVEGTVTNTQLPIDLHNQVVIIKVTSDKESLTKKIVMH